MAQAGRIFDTRLSGDGLPHIQAVAASGVEGEIRRHGGDAALLLRAVGIDPEDIGRPQARFGLDRYCALFERAALECGVASFGLRFGHQCGRALLGVLGELAFAAPTLGAALGALCRYFPLLQEQSSLSLSVRDGRATLAYQIRDGRILARRQDAELTIGSLLRVIRTALGPYWTPSEVWFEHPVAAPRRDYDTLLGAPVYGLAPSNLMHFPCAVLAAAMPEADALVFAAAARRARGNRPAQRADDFLGRVCEEIRVGLPQGDIGLPAVAARLGLAEATLYRRLRRHDLRYSDIVRDLRRALALALLRQRAMPLTEIALLLGYSELSAFTRAFQQWTGDAPSTYRASVRAGE